MKSVRPLGPYMFEFDGPRPVRPLYPAPWNPTKEGYCVADYDASDVASMVMDSAMRVQLWSPKSSDTLQNCLVLPGVAGNYASSPDSAALSITGDIDIRAQVTLNFWIPSTVNCIIAKRTSGDGLAYQLTITTVGRVALSFRTGGVDYFDAAVSSVATPFSNGTAGWIRVTRVASTGATVFYTSTNGTTWNQLGTSASTTAGAINTNAAILEVGSNRTGTQNFLSGNVYRTQIYNGIAEQGGTLAFDANFASASKLATDFVESSSNAAIVTINQTSIALPARIHGERDLYQGLAASQPVWLNYTGVNYGYLNGLSGNYFSTPDSAALDITGDIEIVTRAALNSPTAINCLVAKRTTNNYSYQLVIGNGTNVGFQFSTSLDGTTVLAYASTTYISALANVAYWFKVTRRQSDGRIQFFYANDSVSEPNTWIQVGADVSGTTGSMYVGTSSLEIGSNRGGTVNLTNGNIYRAIVRNGISGTLAFDFNPETYVSGTTFLDSSPNAATITLNGGAVIVKRSCLYFDGIDDYMQSPAFALSQPVSCYWVGRQITWTASDRLVSGGSGAMALIQSGSTPNIVANGGTDVGPTSALVLQTDNITQYILNGASSSLRVGLGSEITGAGGSDAPAGITVGASMAAANFGHQTTSEFVVQSVAATAIQRDRMTTKLAGKWNLTL